MMRPIVLSLAFVIFCSSTAYSRVETSTTNDLVKENLDLNTPQKPLRNFSPKNAKKNILTILYAINSDFDHRHSGLTDETVEELIQEAEALPDYNDYQFENKEQQEYVWNRYLIIGTAAASIYTLAYLTGYAPSPMDIISWGMTAGRYLIEFCKSVSETIYNMGRSVAPQYDLWVKSPENLLENLHSQDETSFTEAGVSFIDGVGSLANGVKTGQVSAGIVDFSKAIKDESLQSVLEHEDWGPFTEALPQARLNTFLVGLISFALQSQIGHF